MQKIPRSGHLLTTMRNYFKSLGHAFEGLFHAFLTERNLRLFGIFYLLSLMLGVTLRIALWEWQIVIFTGGVFLSIELLNTALEHFTDAFDAHSRSIHYSAIKATKDIAASASLVIGMAWGLVLCFIFIPHLWIWWLDQWGTNMSGM